MTPQLPKEMDALIIKSRGEAVVTKAPIPKVRDGYILVQTTAVAINPSDWKHIDYMWVGDPTGTRPGLDYAGVVVDVGNGVEKKFKVGDRVFGIVNGSNVRQPEDGAFAEYTVAKAPLQIKIPDGMHETEAVHIGSGLVAVGQGLYQSLKLPLPTNPMPASEQIPLLIYGGSTASGAMGIQFAKMSGCKVITTCSPHNFDYLYSLGADYCIDYHDADECVTAIRKLTDGKLRHAWDCIATARTARLCAEAIGPDAESGAYSSLLFVNSSVVRKINPNISVSTTIGYTIMGEEFEKETVVPERPEDYAFGKMFWEIGEKLLHEGKFKPVKPIVNEGGKGGLEGVLFGIKHLKYGNVSAGKLVYTMP